MDYLKIRELYHSQLRDNEMYHFGIKGQKWGIRRYQNPDGSLTPEGRERYGKPIEDIKNRDKLLKKSFENDDKAMKILQKYSNNNLDYFDKDGTPYDDYQNYVPDIKTFAQWTGYKGRISPDDEKNYKYFIDNSREIYDTYLQSAKELIKKYGSKTYEEALEIYENM